MLIYANPADVTAWLGDSTPANVTTLLRSASILITDAIKTDYYNADPATGQPTDTIIVQALNDAACAQVAVWVKLGIDPNLAGLDIPAPKRAKGIGSARVDYDTAAQTGAAAIAARQQIATTLCDESVTILKTAGMMMTRVWTYG
jgi:hypothetical protein